MGRGARWSIIAGIGLLVVARIGAAGCGEYLQCRAGTTGTKIMRTTYKPWMWRRANVPAQHFYIDFTQAQYEAMLNVAVSAWHCNQEFVPDDIIGDAGQGNSSIAWVPQEFIDGIRASSPLGEQGALAPAVFVPYFEAGASCRYDNGTIYVAIQPEDPSGVSFRWVADGCFPNCVQSFPALDFRAVMTHEFGHALGLTDARGGGDVDLAMYYAIKVAQQGQWSPYPCETDAVRDRYHDNFGPVAIGRPDVGLVNGNPEIRFESIPYPEDVQYVLCRLNRVDGSRRDVDSVTCESAGLRTYALLDANPISDPVTYSLSVVARLPHGGTEAREMGSWLWGEMPTNVASEGLASTRERVLAGVAIGGTGGRPEDVLRRYVDAINMNDYAEAGDCLADGFMFETSSGEQWGRGIERRLMAALAGEWDPLAHVAPDIRVECVMQLSRLVREDLMEALGIWKTVLKCGVDDVNSKATIVVTLERLHVGGGWRIRRIREIG